MVARFFRHPKVFTGTTEDGWASAFSVDAGVITWVGASKDVPAGADVVDLQGALVLPGLIDAHTHPTYIAWIVDAVPCTVPTVTSIPEMIEALRGHPSYAKPDGGWITGWGYDESKLVERRSPTRHDLDRVSRSQPVYVLRSDAHSGICNTRALEIAGIRRDTPDPEGAAFGRDLDGIPNGVLMEHAANQAVLQAKASPGFEADSDALLRTSAHLAERGIVAVADMFCVPGRYTQLDLYRDAAAHGFGQLARVFYEFQALKQLSFDAISETDREGRTCVGGIKLFLDGSISNQTAWMRDPYRGSTDNRGMRTATRQDLLDALELARRHDIQLAIHAMGDASIVEILDVLGNEEPWLDGFPSVRIEHASVLDVDLIERLRSARMHFGVVTNIDFFFAEYDSYSANLTDDQFSRTYMIKNLYERVEPFALSSDSPATTWYDPDDPFMSIQAAVTRSAYTGADIVPGQAISVGQALLLYTGRARTVTDFGDVGRIVPGAEASFIALDQDLFRIDPTRIIDTRVIGTWMRGEKVFERPADHTSEVSQA